VKNVVLLTIDTLRQDILGCYGNPDGLTPFMDALAEKSVRFTRTQAIAPYTQASFPGILTSSYFFDYPRSKRLSPRRTLVSEVLQKAGVLTAAFHSNPYLCDYFGWNRGWDHFYDSMDDEVTPASPYTKGNVINRKVDRWLSANVHGQDSAPFFIWVHYMDVHEPYVPDRAYIDAVDPSIRLSEDEMLALFKEVILPRDVSDPDTVRLLYKLYCAHVREVDGYAGELFGVLDRHGVREDTVLMVTADHGDEFADHGGLSHDGKMYAELVSTPLLVYDGGSEAGQVCDTLVSGLDISPTLVHFFGLAPVQDFQGHSLFPLDAYPEGGCYGEAIGKLTHRIQPTDKPAYFYREGDVKIMYREEGERWEMYDLHADPGEQTNIVDTSPLAEEMKGKLRPRIGREPR